MIHESKVLTGMHTSHVLPDRSVMMSSGRKAIESTYVCVCVCVCIRFIMYTACIRHTYIHTGDIKAVESTHVCAHMQYMYYTCTWI